VKTAIFGGSFNPVHYGHLLIAREVVGIGYQRILFIPAANPPHKILARGADDADRISMLKLALQDFPRAELWEGEIYRAGLSHSIDTVRELRENGILDSRAGIIIGDDLASDFSSWKEVPKLMDEVDIILARRDMKREVEFGYPCLRLPNAPVPHSSSEIRWRIENGMSIDGLVPFPVAEYIGRNKLYGFA